MSLPIDRTAKSALDTNLNNGITSDAPKVKASNDVVYNTVDELYNYALNLAGNGYTKTQIDNIIAQAIFGTPPAGGVHLDRLGTDVMQRINLIYATEREVANLKAISSIANRVDAASGIFYDLMDGLNGGSIGKIDLTKTNIVGTVAIGAVTVTVKSVTSLIVGQEVTVFDDINREYAIISAINTGTKQLTFAAPLTKAYQDQAEVARSTVTQDTLNRLIKFGGWSKQTTVAVTTPSTVVASAFDTSGNGGRKVVWLPTLGWLVSAVYDSGTTQIKFEKGIPDPSTGTVAWSQLTFATFTASGGFAIANIGTNIYALATNTAGTSASFFKFDAATVTNVAQTALSNPLSGQSSFGAGCSLAIDGNGVFKITACSKNTTYPNSNNAISQKSSDGVTWTKMDGTTGFDQIQTNNTTGTDVTSPCIVVRSNNNPVIITQVYNGNYRIFAYTWTGTQWNAQVEIYNGTTFAQFNHCAAIAQNGRIWCAWHGADATDTVAHNLRVSYSDDGGATWSAMQKLTTGNTYNQNFASVTVDKNNNAYILFQGEGVGTTLGNRQLRKIVYTNASSSWSSITRLTDFAANNQIYPSVLMDNTIDFSDPLVIYKDSDASAIKFRGTWVAGTITPVLVEDVRYNISPANAVSSGVAWVDRETDAGLSLAAALSIHSATEAYSAMTKTTATVDGTTSEDQFVGSGVSNIKATVRLTMTRTSTSVNKGIKSVMGAVGV